MQPPGMLASAAPARRDQLRTKRNAECCRLGVGEALSAMIPKKHAELRSMMEEWPFFSSTMSLIEMTLAKADMNIASAYDETLVQDAKVRQLRWCSFCSCGSSASSVRACTEGWAARTG